MKAIIIKMACRENDKGESEVPGWVVPDTDDLLGIDMRYEADIEYMQSAKWFITHLPSGRRIGYGDYTEAAYRNDAAAIAQRFYVQFKARGWDLTESDPDQVVNPFKTLTKDEQKDFWMAVAGWSQDKEPTPRDVAQILCDNSPRCDDGDCTHTSTEQS